MSTDHPNGASFRAYPQIIRLLMDSTYRQDILKTCHPLVRERCNFGDIDREYTLSEIAIITRAAPARMLGLTHKGHLGVGADADITVYTPNENKEMMFEMPRTVIKGGEIVVDDTDLRYAPEGRTLHATPSYDVDREGEIAEWFEKFYSVRFRNYPVSADYLHDPVAVECRK